MASWIRGSEDDDDDDDFIRTIHDDQSYPLGEEEEEDIIPQAPPKSNLTGKKRKRDHDQGQSNGKDVIVERTKGATNKRPKTQSLSVHYLTGEPEEDDQNWTAQGNDDGAINSDFEIQIGDVDVDVTESFDGWGLNDSTTAPATQAGKKGADVDELIARRSKGAANGHTGPNGIVVNGGREVGIEPGNRSDSEVGEFDAQDEGDDETLAEDAFGMGALASEEDSEDDAEMDQASSASLDDESVAEPVAHPEDVERASSPEEIDDLEEQARREAFFAPEEDYSKVKTKGFASGSFQSMSLSRPILRGLAAVGFSESTPIQKKTIPIALEGKDVVGGAVTGSGKTAAFIIPILERLLYRPKKVPTSRVAILMPTRELAVQCFSVAKKLASFTDITFCQLVGGFSLREQESVLRNRPDVIIATPGRFIDHMRNSASFTVDTLEILVLDEADRMLEDGFADELNEILTTIPKSRQTMLFSATMTDTVDRLIRVGLNRPVRLMVDARKQTVGTLVQEFVRLRPGREDKRLGYLLYLCQDVYTDRVIIFFRQKKEAHRVRIIFGLCDIKAAELHGSMSQEQRIAALTSFRSSQSTHLLATDLASRGLDISNISTVINYEAPQSHEIYLHRVGRTARAGRAGRSCTIAAEPDRKVVKQAVKSGKAQGARIVSRVVEAGLADEWAKKAEGLRDEVEAILKEEKEEKALTGAEMHVRKGENIMNHEAEIKSRPKRTWFESEKEKQIAKKSGQVELNGAVGLGKKKVGKLSGKDKKMLDDRRERKEGRMWKKGKGDERGGGEGRSKGGPGRKGKGGKDRGGKAKKIKGGGGRI